MKVDLEKHGSVCVVVPRDALSAQTLPEVQKVLDDELSAGGKRLVVDLTHVSYVDSGGIELLLRVAGDRGASAVRPRLACLSPMVREALYLTDTIKRFIVFESVESAVRSYL